MPLEHSITIEEAINLTSGNRKYQKQMMGILILGLATLSLVLVIYISYYNLEDIWIYGPMIGSFFPWLSDRYGRKKIIIICSLISCVSLIYLTILTAYDYVWIPVLVLSAVTYGIQLTSVILCVETIDFKKRNQYLGFIWILIPVSYIFIIQSLNYLEVYLQIILFFATIMMVLQVIFLLYIEESPRFLLTNKVNIKAATKVINRISLCNTQESFKYSLLSENIKKQESVYFQDIFHSKIITLQLLAGSLVWTNVLMGGYFCSSAINYFLFAEFWISFAVNMSGLVGVLIIMYTINHIGRKKTIAISFAGSGVLFFIIFILYEYYDESITELVDFATIFLSLNLLSGQAYLVNIHTAEIFPTQMRGSAFSFCNIIAVLIIYILDLTTFFDKYYLQIVGTSMLLSAGCCVVLQETLGKEIDEMIENTITLPLLPPRIID